MILFCLLQDRWSLEYYPVFQVTTSIPAKSLSFGGWVTGIPYNKDKIFTHIDLIDKNVILIHKDSYKYVCQEN